MNVHLKSFFHLKLLLFPNWTSSTPRLRE